MFLTCPSDPEEHSTKLHERKCLFKKVSDSQDAAAQIVACFLYKKPLQGVNCIQGRVYSWSASVLCSDLKCYIHISAS